MAPTNPRGKKNTTASGFPGLKPSQSNNPPPSKSQYEEIQENELIALSSIYGDDFQKIETKQGAWKVRTI
jgi:translation initiation factor 2-alpha kinase 4